MKKVLVIGATGAMGTYLMEKFAATDYQVDGVYQECAPESLFAPRVFAENLRYISAGREGPRVHQIDPQKRL